MKALTIHQPWASLITARAKTIETRSWKPPRNMIGERIAIHASRINDYDSLPYSTQMQMIADMHLQGWMWHTKSESEKIEPLKKLPLKKIIGYATLMGFGMVKDCRSYKGAVIVNDVTLKVRDKIVHRDRDHWYVQGEKRYGDYSIGRWLWNISYINALPKKDHYQIKGKQLLWEVPPEVAALDT